MGKEQKQVNIRMSPQLYAYLVQISLPGESIASCARRLIETISEEDRREHNESD